MVDKLQSLCELCYYGEVRLVDGYMIKGYSVEKHKRMVMYCKYSFQFRQKFIKIKECPINAYIPKVGQITKKIYQKSMGDFIEQKTKTDK